MEALQDELGVIASVESLLNNSKPVAAERVRDYRDLLEGAAEAREASAARLRAQIDSITRGHPSPFAPGPFDGADDGSREDETVSSSQAGSVRGPRRSRSSGSASSECSSRTAGGDVPAGTSVAAAVSASKFTDGEQAAVDSPEADDKSSGNDRGDMPAVPLVSANDASEGAGASTCEEARQPSDPSPPSAPMQGCAADATDARSPGVEA